MFSSSFGAPQGVNPPDPQTHAEPQLLNRDQIQSHLATIGTPESLRDAVAQNPEQVFQLLHSTFHYNGLDLRELRDNYDRHELESSQQQEALETQAAQQREKFQEAFNNQEVTMNGYQDQIQDLNQNLAKARLQETSPLPLNTNSSHSHRSPKVPDPERFDGTRIDLDGFKYKLMSKLQDNEDWYPTPQSQVNYAFGRLEGKAARQILPRINPKNAASIKNMTDFYQALETCFGDPDKKHTAQQYVNKLKQANKPFAEYLTLFQSYIGDAGFDEEQQLYLFKNGLSRELQAYLVPIDVSEMDMDAFIKTCHRLEKAHRQIQQNGASIPKGLQPVTPAAAVNASTNDGNTAMDLSKVQSRARGPLTAEEKQRRYEGKLCLYCGDPGHQAISCPKKKPKAAIRTAELASPTPAVPELNGQEKA